MERTTPKTARRYISLDAFRNILFPSQFSRSPFRFMAYCHSGLRGSTYHSGGSSRRKAGWGREGGTTEWVGRRVGHETVPFIFFDILSALLFRAESSTTGAGLASLFIHPLVRAQSSFNSCSSHCY